MHASATVPLEPAAAQPGPAAARELLAFRLGAQEYGVDILRVQEIRSYERPTRIAHAPHYVKGVVNLRGAIVPIVDLRLKFGQAQADYDAFTVVIVLHVGPRIVGMVVDAVSDVVTLAAAQLRPVPESRAGIGAEHLQAIGACEQRPLLVLDADKLLSHADLGLAAPTLQ
jgi:purine-binding chemotaxis protein CheW